ncbi:MAG: PH domain-containing protein [Clostridiales Family XIII bacterium]|jgi:membrane protein YdbS with pleckstrin-like domain|nr:PH domain-containing protein [Clostridiales Family XIII bacterium]
MRPLPSERLNQKIKAVWRINSLIATFCWTGFLICPIIVLIVLTEISRIWLVIPIALFLVWRVPAFFVFPRIRYARWRYEILHDEVDILEGLFFVTRTIIPMIRVQYTDTSQGPIMRAFKLSSVAIVTAGGTVKIPGLTPQDADALRDKIAALAKIAKEDV